MWQDQEIPESWVEFVCRVSNRSGLPKACTSCHELPLGSGRETVKGMLFKRLEVVYGNIRPRGSSLLHGGGVNR